jgi:hypothetical protein
LPFNEPQWEWKDGNQEGSPWDNRELAKATRIIDSVFTTHEIASKIEISEAGAIDYLTSEKDKYINRSNQIEEFFNSNSKNYIGDLKGLSTKFAGHSYFSTWDVSVLKSKREKIAEKLGKYPNLEYWMTEYCVLENNEIINGQGKDLGINTALYVARLIHADLTIANASAWHWWLALSPYDYKDGLIYHDKYKTDGSFQTSKMLWALGNYSRFIRPEAKRIKVDYQDYNSDDNLKNGVLISAYKNKDNSMVMVIVNQKKKDIKIDFNVFDKKYNIPFSIYRTDHNLDLREISNTKPYSEIELPQKSISTLVFK